VSGMPEDQYMGAYSKKAVERFGEQATMNMAARCGGHAVKPMVWPMLLRWDGCGWNRNNGMPTLERIIVEA